MRKQIFISLLIIIFHSAAATHAAQQNPLMIKGQVLDAEGRPVPRAVVYAYPDGGLNGVLPSSSSDERGEFTIAVSQAGVYAVVASKQVDGYPSAMSPFYNPTAESLIQVLLKENQPPPFVTVRFGPKAGRVAGHIVDAETNRPIEDFQISLCRLEVPMYCHRLSDKYPGGRFQVLVPSAPFTIQISASGYKDWYGAERASQQLEPMQVAADTTKELSVSLYKLPALGDEIPNGSMLEAPLLLSPTNDSEFSHYPRITKLEWSAVPGAASYTVEVEFCASEGADKKECEAPQPLQYRSNPPMAGIEGTSYEFVFIGAQPGRWRVWAVDAQGKAGAKSAWFKFIYKQ
jgi:Carboxypeptidase regulatory-like domain